MSQPSHFVKASGIKYAILTNNTYLLVLDAQKTNKSINLINLFSDKLVTQKIGDYKKDTCTIELLGMAPNNEQ